MRLLIQSKFQLRELLSAADLKLALGNILTKFDPATTVGLYKKAVLWQRNRTMPL